MFKFFILQSQKNVYKMITALGKAPFSIEKYWYFFLFLH